jgi:hypothetical protein
MATKRLKGRVMNVNIKHTLSKKDIERFKNIFREMGK